MFARCAGHAQERENAAPCGVIYFYHDANHPLYLLMVYAKARHENLSPDERRTVREITALLKGKPK